MEKVIIEKESPDFKVRLMTELKAKIIPIVIFLIVILVGSSNYLIVGIFVSVLVVVFWRVFIQNIYHIIKIELNAGDLFISYAKFNSIHECQIPIRNVQIKIAPVHLLERRYKLKLLDNGTQVLKQFEINNWTKAEFDVIKTDLTNAKSELS